MSAAEGATAASSAGVGTAVWDVFVSYSRSDAQRAGVVVSALRARGLRVFVDDSAVDDFSSISGAITRALAHSRVLLSFFSTDYPGRRACQWELTFAYLSGQREGDPRRRVLVINPERTSEHIHPVELRDARHWPWPDTPEATDQFAARVAAHVGELTEPMGSTAVAAFVPWLPAPARTGSARFVGRLTEQWRVHSALHRHRAPLVGQSGADRAAQLRGMPGIGKSLLAQEYALRFRSAYPGGVFWFDLHDDRGGRDPDGTMDAYAEQVATVASALGLEVPVASLPRLLSRLAVALGERNADCLWVVDGVPDGLSQEQLHLLRGPHLLASTLLTTRSLRYTPFAEPVDLPPLPDADGFRLLTSRRTPRGQADQEAAVALVHDVGGHPQALDLLAELGARTGFVHIRNRLHSPGTDVLVVPEVTRAEGAERGEGANSPASTARSLSATLLTRPLTGDHPLDDVLRLFALACPAPLSAGVLENVLSTLAPYDPWDTATVVAESVDTLLGAGALRNDLAHDGSWTIHALLARAVRRHDTDTARQEDLRRALLHALATPPGSGVARGTGAGASGAGASGSGASGTYERQVGRGAGAVERAAAYDLQVELVTRIGVEPLLPEQGGLREALTSLHSLIATSRDVLHRVAGETARPLRLPAIATGLIRALRPFLATWHPALQEHEAMRPEGTSPIAHERSWECAAEMRTALGELRVPLSAVARDLAQLSGIDVTGPVHLPTEEW